MKQNYVLIYLGISYIVLKNWRFVTDIDVFFLHISTGECRDPYFSLLQISEWNVILAASYNAVEIGVIGEFKF